MRVLFVVDGDDPTGLTLARAAARLGHSTTLGDLRRTRFELRTGSDGGPFLDGAPVDVDVVVNRTDVNGLGLASPVALRRQLGSTWYELHSAAREEQGLLLAVLDAFELSGTRVINGPAAVEMDLMRNLVVERLARRGVALTPSEVSYVSYLVTCGRVALQPGQDRPGPDVLGVCKLVSEVAHFDLGAVRFGLSAGGHRLVGWTQRPELTHLDRDTASAIAESLMLELVGKADNGTVPPLRPFIPDMVERFEQT